jgi:transcriptional regulator with XRE-family HTH domain
MDEALRRQELKAFLRARRRALVPEAFGVDRDARRRTAGLRREEVAALAKVGVTWYTWLEQGREINVSKDTLERISFALRLDETDRAYLFALAAAPVQTTDDAAIELPPTLQLVLDGFVSGPAVVITPTWNVLAYNALANLIFEFEPHVARYAKNQLWRGFMDPARRRLYVDWELTMRNVVGIFRMSYARHVGEPAFVQLIDELSGKSDDFVRIWKDRETKALNPFVLRLRHDRLGILALHSVRFPVDRGAGALMIMAPPADAQTAAKLAHASTSPSVVHRRQSP